MARQQTSLLRRSFAQVDMAFWCIHEHVATLFILALPALLLIAAIAASAAFFIRGFELPALYQYALYGVLYPTLLLWVFTFAPLPCAVFAWHRSSGRVLGPEECFRAVAARGWRLMWVSIRLLIYYLLWFLLAGIPMLWLWPRTCLTPMVALFEDDRRVFRRGRMLLKEDIAVHLLALIHLCLLLALAALIFLPRLLIDAQIIANPWTITAAEYLWVFESLGVAMVLCGLAVSWCLSLTLLYFHVRQLREGESLRRQIAEVRERLRPAAGY